MAEGGLETGLEGPTDERLPSLFCQPSAAVGGCAGMFFYTVWIASSCAWV